VELAEILEGNVGAEHEVPDGAGDDDAAGRRCRHDPGREMDGEPCRAVGPDVDLSGVQPDPDLQARLGERVRDMPGAEHGAGGLSKPTTIPSPVCTTSSPRKCATGPPDHGVVFMDHFAPAGVADLRRDGGGPDDVGSITVASRRCGALICLAPLKETSD